MNEMRECPYMVHYTPIGSTEITPNNQPKSSMDEWNGMGKLGSSNADVALMVWSYWNIICGIVRAHIGLEYPTKFGC